MSTATEIEKENLEAHVELCAERYEALEEKLNKVEEKVSSLETVVREVKDLVMNLNDSRQKRVINYGRTVVVSLIVLLGWMVVNYMMPAVNMLG